MSRADFAQTVSFLMQVQSSWLRLGGLNLVWPGVQAVLLWRHRLPDAGAGGAVLVVVPMVLIAFATLHFAVRVVIQNGIVAVSYPFRLRKKTCLFLVSEIHRLLVPPGVINALHFFLDEHTCIRLPCCGLSAAAVAYLKAEISAGRRAITHPVNVAK